MPKTFVHGRPLPRLFLLQPDDEFASPQLLERASGSPLPRRDGKECVCVMSAQGRKAKVCVCV
eukprot:3757973-Pyramimonas_sp.AAC.1